MSEPANRIDLTGVKVLGPRSVEVARLWVTDQGPSTVFINFRPLAEPFSFGVLLADTAHHAAKAYAKRNGVTEEEALVEIWKGLDAERANPSGSLEEADPFGRNN